MKRSEMTKTLAKPFQSPWLFLVLTLFFGLSSSYMQKNHSILHEAASYSEKTTSKAEEAFGIMLRGKLDEGKIREFIGKCADGTDPEAFSPHTASLDSKTLEKVRPICEYLYYDKRFRSEAPRGKPRGICRTA